MNINKLQKVILLLAIIATLIQCVLFVPQNIKYTTFSAQNVPHSVIIRAVYKPIWYNHKENWYNYEIMQEVKNPEAYRNYIDWQRLGIQLFASCSILGCAFLIAKKSKQKG